MKTHLLNIHFLGKSLKSDCIIGYIHIDAVVNLEWVLNTNVKIILKYLKTSAFVFSRFTFGSLYFSRRHTLSVARSAFLCKKSASLSILK